MLYLAQSKIQERGSIVGIGKGDMSCQFTRALVCSSVIMLLIIFILAFK
jgi:hypothetical protein